jgi:hypothetical protein
MQPAELIDDAAIDLLAAKLRTPLQIEQHLSLAFEFTLPKILPRPPLRPSSEVDAKLKKSASPEIALKNEEF